MDLLRNHFRMLALCLPLLVTFGLHFQINRNGQPGNCACALDDALKQVLRREHEVTCCWP